eukprot:gene930-1174_t
MKAIPGICLKRKYLDTCYIPSKLGVLVPIGRMSSTSYYKQNTSQQLKCLKMVVEFHQKMKDMDPPINTFKRPYTTKKFADIPQGVVYLKIICQDRYPLPGEIPTSVTHLVFDINPDTRLLYFDYLPLNAIPENVVYLEFKHFNQAIPVGALPKNLVHLNFGPMFNRTLDDGAIPESVRILNFGNNFNSEIGSLPERLEHLSFGPIFDNKIKHHLLPKGLKYFKSGKKIMESIPATVKELVLKDSNFLDFKPGYIPSSVTKLKLLIPTGNPFICSIPEGVVELTLYGTLPSISTDEVMEYEILSKLIPTTVKELSLFTTSEPVNGKILKYLPVSLTRLHIEILPCPLKKGQLPSSLISLTFGSESDSPLEPGVLPEGLEELVLGFNFNKSLSLGSIPQSVTSLTFGDNFNQAIPKGIIPEGIKKLELGTNFKFKPNDYFPPSITELSLCNLETQLPGISILDNILITPSLELKLFKRIDKYKKEYYPFIVGFIQKFPNQLRSVSFFGAEKFKIYNFNVGINSTPQLFIFNNEKFIGTFLKENNDIYVKDIVNYFSSLCPDEEIRKQNITQPRLIPQNGFFNSFSYPISFSTNSNF